MAQSIVVCFLSVERDGAEYHCALFARWPGWCRVLLCVFCPLNGMVQSIIVRCSPVGRDGAEYHCALFARWPGADLFRVSIITD